MLTRIVIQLDSSERNALAELAERERREPRQQAAFIIRRWLELTGYLKPTTPQEIDVPKKDCFPP